MSAKPEVPLTKAESESFDDSDISSIEEGLSDLGNAERVEFRNQNARTIASDESPRMLVVAGPGAGKSFLFMDRIRSWLSGDTKGRIHVASFVRKLVVDLKTDVETLESDQVKRVEVSTLHSLARSLIERNGGSSSHPLGPYIRIISKYWEDVVWADVWSLSELPDVSLENLKAQFHDDVIPTDPPWPTVRNDYFRVCRFYNSVGFADSIVLAREAVLDNPELVEPDLWIFDEFQDFNTAEKNLIQALTSNSRGVLLAGDDDQAVYQELKASHPEIIRNYFKSTEFAKALLPFCSRCSHHIALAGRAFLRKHQEPDSIPKVFLPLTVDEDDSPVQVVGFAHPSGMASYIETFVAEHGTDIEQRQEAIRNGQAKDPYLLILSFSRNLSYLGPNPESRVESIAGEWEIADSGPGPDYFLALLYARAGKYANDNFTVRKVLHYDNVPDEVVHPVLARALQSGKSLAEEGASEFSESLARCRQVLAILNDGDADSAEKTRDLAEIISLEDEARFAGDLTEFPVEEGGSYSRDEEEEVFTPQSLAAVEILSMAGAKGLSADHVIVIGCDQLNMGYASPQLFFVTLTRARTSLHLLTSLKAQGGSKPHSYLADLPDDHCSYFSSTKSKGLVELDSYSKLTGWLQFIQRRFSGSKK